MSVEEQAPEAGRVQAASPARAEMPDCVCA